MTVIKRKGFQDVNEKDLKPINEIMLEIKHINPSRELRHTFKFEAFPDLIVFEPASVYKVKTVIIGDDDGT